MPPPSRKPGQTPKIISVASKASPQRQTASREDIDIDEPPIEESTDLVLIKSQPVEDDEVTGEGPENIKRKATGKDHLSKCIDLTREDFLFLARSRQIVISNYCAQLL